MELYVYLVKPHPSFTLFFKLQLLSLTLTPIVLALNDWKCLCVSLCMWCGMDESVYVSDVLVDSQTCEGVAWYRWVVASWLAYNSSPRSLRSTFDYISYCFFCFLFLSCCLKISPLWAVVLVSWKTTVTVPVLESGFVTVVWSMQHVRLK